MEKIIFKDKIYIPITEDKLSRKTDKLNEYFRVNSFEDKNCEKCDLINGLGDRPIADCYECPSMKAQYKLWSTTTKNGQLYVGFPYGKRGLISRIFPDVSNMEQRDLTPISKRERKLVEV